MKKKLIGKNPSLTKVLISLTMLLFLVSGVFLFCACEETGTEGLIYSYDEESSTATVTGYIGNVTDVVIPSTVKGYSVTAIEDYAFYACSGLSSVKFPETATSIGEYSFAYCTSLNSINIPDSVTSVGKYSFINCNNATSLTIGENVSTIGACAFSECVKLTSINFNASNFETVNSQTFHNVGKNSEGVSLVIGKNVCSLPNSLFSSTNLTSLIFEKDSVCQEIASQCFYSCSSLESVFLGENINTIGSYAFENCSSLTDVYIDNLASWFDISFGNSTANPLCSAQFLHVKGENGAYELVENLVVPSSVSKINSYAFYNCESLTNISISDSVTEIGSYAFYGCSNVENLEIGTNVSSLGSYSFYGCTALNEINFNATKANNLSSSNYVFYNAGQNSDGLTVVFGENVGSVPSYLFYPYSSSSTLPNISTVIFSDNCACSNIGSYAFYASGSIESVYVEDIETWCNISFANAYSNPLNYVADLYCKNENKEYELLTSATIPNTISTINDYAFYNYQNLESVTIPESITSIGSYSFYNCTLLTEINYNAIAADDLSAGNYTFYKAGLSQVGIVLNIGSKVKSIPSYLFCPYTNITYLPVITTVKFAEGSLCENVGDNAFYRCDYTESVYVEDVETWCNISFANAYSNPMNCGAFLYCKNELDEYEPLTTLTTPSTISSINSYAFYNCLSLENVVISDNVTSIGTYSFYKCTNLEDITIGSEVKNILTYAFYNCTNLSNVTFKTTSGWATSSTEFSSEEIATASTAAEYLTTSYYKYSWTRS